MGEKITKKLRPLSARAVAILHTLLVGGIGGMAPVLVPGDSRKFDRGSPGFMPACVECIAPGAVSIAHYGMMNGDPMRDPDVCLFTTGDEWYAYSFRNDYVGVDLEHVDLRWDRGRPIPVGARVAAQHDLTEFAEMFLANVADQQGIVVPRVTP